MLLAKSIIKITIKAPLILIELFMAAPFTLMVFWSGYYNGRVRLQEGFHIFYPVSEA
jgi:hypothetical protein